ncbi:chaplin [Streptomyces carpaticus]|uniref:Small secreted domain n=2 Tax=Streptomyces TaxID=1883 RepID=A0A1I6S6C3_9ACTN|nr:MULTISPECIES: chaplin [Streptomyces]MCK1817252.1 chaplin [Streptomyces sp. XM4011]QKV68120.1 chaplin [Streptomyces harbinensis]UWM48435.1 chaplin [Streptomyces carpaticus]SFS72492.1 Small secreted domain [Streptomyces harbinensis]
MNTAKKAAFVLAAAGVAVGSAAGLAAAHDGASAKAKAVHSPGVISGNIVQIPVDVPINIVGNTLNVVGLLNPAFGNVGAIV